MAAGSLGALCVLVCASIVMRFVFNAPIRDTFDLSRLLLGIAVFWGLAAATVRDEHITADIVSGWLGPRGRAWITAIGHGFLLVCAIVLAWKLLDKVLDVRRTAQETSELRWAIWPFYAAAWVAALLTIPAALARIVLVFGGGATDLATRPEDGASA